MFNEEVLNVKPPFDEYVNSSFSLNVTMTQVMRDTS